MVFRLTMVVEPAREADVREESFCPGAALAKQEHAAQRAHGVHVSLACSANRRGGQSWGGFSLSLVRLAGALR